MLSSGTAAPVNLQESDTGAVLVEEEEVIQKKTSRPEVKLELCRSLIRSRHRKRASLPDSLKPADVAYIRSLNIYDQAIYDAVARPLYGHVGRLDCLMNVKRN
jgi:hypothetical protein